MTFYTSKKHVHLPIKNIYHHHSHHNTTSNTTSNTTGVWRELPIPLDAEVGTFADQLLIELRSDWVLSNNEVEKEGEKEGEVVVLKAGSLVAVGIADLVRNTVKGE
jgi:hypothetical protein